MGESELFWRADDQAQRLLEQNYVLAATICGISAGLRNTG